MDFKIRLCDSAAMAMSGRAAKHSEVLKQIAKDFANENISSEECIANLQSWQAQVASDIETRMHTNLK